MYLFLFARAALISFVPPQVQSANINSNIALMRWLLYFDILSFMPHISYSKTFIIQF